MTLDDVRDALASIERAMSERDDDEAAHSTEKELWEKVLQTIAAGVSTVRAQELAREALRTRDIEFRRWFA